MEKRILQDMPLAIDLIAERFDCRKDEVIALEKRIYNYLITFIQSKKHLQKLFLSLNKKFQGQKDFLTRHPDLLRQLRRDKTFRLIIDHRIMPKETKDALTLEEIG